MTQQLVQLDFTTEELNDLADKCYSFTELFCARAFYPYQEPMAKAMIRDVIGNLGNTLSGLYARQSGKSETVANVAAALMVILPRLANMLDDENHLIFPQLKDYRRGFWVGIFSPSNTQSSTTYKRLRDRMTSVDGRFYLGTPEFALDGYNSLLPFVANTTTYIELNNGSFCLMMSADKQSNIESKTFHLILLDESQDLDEFVVGKSISPMGAATNATTVATGTPGTTKGFFYNMIQQNKSEDNARSRDSWRLQPQAHFQYDYKTVQRYNPNYKKYVAKEKRKLGEESDEFKMAYRLIWLLERGMAVPQELFDELTRRDLNIKTEYKESDLVAGLDWGKGQDSTVLTIGRPIWEQVDEAGRCPVEVIYWWDKLGDNYEQIFAELKDKIAHFHIRTIACDATGVGEPLVDRLTWELPYITVLPVKFSSQSKDHLYKWFLLMLQERKCWWPGLDRVRKTRYFKAFEQQMTNLHKEYKGQYLTCHAPEDQKNAHDDFPDSLALMLWCINEEAMPFVEVSTGGFYEQDRNWQNNPNGRFGRTGGRFSLHGG